MSAQDLNLDKILTMPEVAAIAGWKRRRMLRNLLRINEEVGRTLLRNIGTKDRPRWTVTLGALQRVAPEWFRGAPKQTEDRKSVTDAAELEERVDRIEQDMKHVRRQMQLTYETVASLVA